MTDIKQVPGYVDPDYLQQLAELARPIKQLSYVKMNLKAGSRVLDVGCGPGTDTILMASLVGPRGEVVGIDHDAEMVREADRRAQEASVYDWARHRQGDATHLPFEDNCFDACRSERLFQHLRDPERALAEMVRVTRPGGKIVVVDTDQSSVSILNEMPDIEWKQRRIRADMLANGYSGRNLFGYFRRSRLEDIDVEIFPLIVTDYAVGRYISIMDQVEKIGLETGVLTTQEINAFGTHLEELQDKGQFFAYGVMMIAVGQKPSA